ncbi:MAG: peptide-methionine (S)-S-oxide reductase MsrA [bacterium]|nr:peptide-methionine (S)-S-oxide reductase MsrA [bacterium]
MEKKSEAAVFGGGCFWCTEAVFKELRGVVSVASGYAGGNTEHPSYGEVSMGRTGHAEVIKIEFDPQEISYRDLLTVFFATHDPTTENKQGADVGTQYRSVIFTTTQEQKNEAEKYIAELVDSGVRVVTGAQPLTKFYEAEDEHKNYYEKNSSQPYCQIVIVPKLLKLQMKFRELLKSHSA